MKPFWTLFLCAVCAVSAAHAATVVIDDDQMARINGKRTFILGMYETPKEDAIYDELAAAGFNLVYSGTDMEALDKLAARGMFAWINTGGQIDLSDTPEAGKKHLADLVAKFGAHPALITWEVPDEALWNCWYGATMWRRNAEVRQQREKIAALADKALAEKLAKDRDEVERLFGTGRAAEAEALADAIWEALGEEQPHPGLNLSNAQERADKMAEGMLAGYEELRRLDPAHPVVMNHVPRNSIAQLAHFTRAADVIACDIYPVPRSRHVGHSDLMDQTPSCVGGYTERLKAAAPGKPVWLVLQGFGWADIQPDQKPEIKKEMRRPTLAETRFMAYNAIVRGARGLVYWGTAYVEKDSDFWKDLMRAIRELADLQPVLSAPDAGPMIEADLAPTWGSLDRGVVALPKNTDSGMWLLVVNEWTDPLTYTLPLGEEHEGKRYTDPAAGVAATVKDGVLTLPIGPQSVHVLRPE
ncbi:MAG TPA: beta-galactosidase [Candidatus Hydrogenedentes bacterium]|nr:beta-galactosidase [Candidatus Hydrogenedentota bacterium]